MSAIAPAIPSAEKKRPLIVHAPSSRRRKGTEHVVAAVDGLDADFRLVEGLTHDEAFELYREADIVVDQLNAGWYGVFAIECLALGKPVVTFLHDEAVRRTEEAYGVEVPVVSATAETLRERLRPLVEDAPLRHRIGAASRAYAERLHDIDAIAGRARRAVRAHPRLTRGRALRLSCPENGVAELIHVDPPGRERRRGFASATETSEAVETHRPAAGS